MRRRRNPEIIAGRVNTDGTIISGEGFVVNKGGTGIYSLLFPNQFRLSSLTITSCGDTVPRVCTFVGSGNSASALVYTLAGASVDDKFSFVAVGVSV